MLVTVPGTRESGSSAADGGAASHTRGQAAATHGPAAPPTRGARCFLHATATATRRGTGWQHARGPPGARTLCAHEPRGSSSAVQGLRWPCCPRRGTPRVTAQGQRVTPPSLRAVRTRPPRGKQMPPHSRSESPAPGCCGRPFPTRKPVYRALCFLHTDAAKGFSQASFQPGTTHADPKQRRDRVSSAKVHAVGLAASRSLRPLGEGLAVRPATADHRVSGSGPGRVRPF